MARVLCKTPPWIVAVTVWVLAMLAWPVARAQEAAGADDMLALLGQVGHAFATHDWRALAALGLTLVVMLVRWLAGLKPGSGPDWFNKAVSWLRTDRGGAVTALVVGLLSALAATIGAGPVTLSVLGSALVNAFIAAGGYALVKKLIWPSDAAKPSLAPDSIVKTPLEGKVVEKIAG